jgi:hypothetical protein
MAKQKMLQRLCYQEENSKFVTDLNQYYNNMNEHNIFISVGGTANEKQESFVSAIEARLRSENLVPNTVGRNKFSSDSPLKTIIELLDECSGTIIIALERTYFPSGIEKRGGSMETTINEIRIPTPWNQIEAAMAYSKGQPLLLIIEEGLKNEGLIEKGYDWYIMRVKPDISSLATPEFNGVLASWKKKVEDYQSNKQASVLKTQTLDPSALTVGEIIKNLKPAHLWAIIVALAGIISGAFLLGQHFGK